MKVRVIVNRSGGTLKGADDEEAKIVAAFAAAGVEADIRMTDSADIYEALKEAAAAAWQVQPSPVQADPAQSRRFHAAARAQPQAPAPRKTRRKT